MKTETEYRYSPVEGVEAVSVIAPHKIDNPELVRYLNGIEPSGSKKRRFDPSEITSRTGILSRFHLQPLGATPEPISKTVPELAISAAEEVIKKKGLVPAAVDILAVVTSYPIGRKISDIVADRIRANNCLRIDVYGACVGFPYFLHEIKRHLSKGTKVVVSLPEHYSSSLGKNLDLSIFSDGAFGLAWDGRDMEIMSSDFIVEENDAIQMPIDESLIPEDSLHFPIPTSLDQFKMRGLKVLRWLAKGPLLNMTKYVAQDSHISEEDNIIPHPASGRALDFLQDALPNIGIKAALSRLSLPKMGNHGAGGIASEIAELIKAHKLTKNKKALLTGFGAGLAVAITSVRFLKESNSS